MNPIPIRRRHARRVRTLALLAASTVSLALWAGAAQASSAASSVRPTSQAAATLDETATLAAAIPDTTGETGTDNTPDTKGQCHLYNFCLWKNAGFGDPFWPADYFTSPHNTWIPVGNGLSGQASSLWNNRDSATLIADGLGHGACVPPHTWYRNLAHWFWPPDFTTTANDSIRFIRFPDPAITCAG